MDHIEWQKFRGYQVFRTFTASGRGGARLARREEGAYLNKVCNRRATQPDPQGGCPGCIGAQKCEVIFK
jgi:hypothetical protein